MSYLSRITYHVSRITYHIAKGGQALRIMYHVLHRIDAGLILAALLTMFIIQSLLQPGLPTLADLPIHLYRTLEYGQVWASGVVVPRWAPNLAYGYGYPLFIFAPPLPYWLGLAFHALGFSLETAFKLLIILTILLYAIGMYLLARDLLHSVEAGLVAATAYAFAPFALREALLYGGNIPQFLAIGLFPWTLWATARATHARSWAWAVLAACFYAGVLLSHLFQALIFTPVVGLFSFILLRLPVVSSQMSEVSRQQLEAETETSPPALYHLLSTIRYLLSTTLRDYLRYPLAVIPLGLLLAAFFWIPAFTERVFTRAQTDIYLAKSPFYVRYPHWAELITWIEPLDARAANPYVPLTLGVVTLILATLGFIVVIKAKLSNYQVPSTKYQSPPPVYCLPSTVYLIAFFAAFAVTAIFMALPISRPLWETITILQVAEFPWRMLGLANLGLAFLAGAAMLWPPARLRWPLTIACVGLQIVVVAPYLYPVIDFTQYGSISMANQVDYERRSQSIGTTTLGEYLPWTVSRPPTTSPLVESFLAGQDPERLDRASLPRQATAKLLKQNAVTHIYQINSPTDFTVRFLQFDYPGWQAQLNDQPASIRPEPETGLILIDIPAGEHILTLLFGETPGRIIALALSGLTVISLTIAGVSILKRKTANTRPPAPDPRSPVKGQLNSVATLLSMLLIITAAFWFKPLLQPVFTLHSPPGQALPAQHQTEINFANGIQLIGYDLGKKIVRPGAWFQVALYWQTNAAPIKANLQPFVHLDRLDNFTTIADATNYAPGDATTESVLPTFHWDNARYVRDEHDLIVPPDIPPIAYAIRVGLIDPDQQNRLVPLADGSSDTAQLTIVNVVPTQEQASQLAESLEVSFDTQNTVIRLTGFELDSVTPEQLDFRLAWQAHETPSADYTVFAQLVDRENNLVASYDRPPLDGAYPTSTWLPGQVTIDPRFIPLGDVPAGDYRLVVGLYDPTTEQRLPTTSGADSIELTTVTIGKP